MSLHFRSRPLPRRRGVENITFTIRTLLALGSMHVCVFAMLLPHWTNAWSIARHSHFHPVPSPKARLCFRDCQNIQRIHDRDFSLQAKHVPKPSHSKTKTEVEVEAALQTIWDDLSSMRSHRRTSKITCATQTDTDTDYRSRSRMKQLANALRKSPALVQAILHNSNDMDDNDDDDDGRNERGVMSLPQLASLVGPMHKARLVDMLCRHPDLFSRVLTSPSIRSKDSQLRQDLNLTPTQYNRFHQTIPTPLWKRVYRNDIRSILHLLQTEAHLHPTDIQSVLTSQPTLLAYTPSKLRASLAFLLSEDVGMEREDVRKMIVARPLVLTHGVETKLKPTLEFLRLELGSTAWKRIASRYPQVFSHSVERLRFKANSLQKDLKLKQWRDVSHVVSGFPPLLWLKQETILEKVNFLREALDINDDLKEQQEELRDLFVTYPQLLGLSLENNLRPKIDYFLASPLDDDDNHMSHGGGAGMTRLKLKEFVLYQPSLLGYSLEKRIRPRIAKLQENFISFGYAPPYLMSLSDEKFRQWLEMQTSTWSIQ